MVKIKIEQKAVGSKKEDIAYDTLHDLHRYTRNFE